MPRASIWLVRAALVHLVLGAVLGTWLLAAKGGALPVPPTPVLGGHAAVMVIGWLVQGTLGVAWWILPRMPAEPVRGPEWIPWTTLILFNLGIVSLAGGPVAGRWAVLLGLGLALVGALVFAAGVAPRIKAFGAARSR